MLPCSVKQKKPEKKLAKTRRPKFLKELFKQIIRDYAQFNLSLAIII